jgi:hypothetical protein
MTRGADMRRVMVKSSALAILATLFTLPYFHYLIFSVPDEGRFLKGINPWDLLLTQLFLLFIVCFLSATVGFSFSKRFALPGFGDPRRFIPSIPFLLMVGGGMIGASYLLFDRYFLEVSPVSYPKDALYLISLPLKGAFTDEIILRLCLVTLGVGLLKRRGAGVILVSALAPLFSMKYFHFIGMESGLNYLFITHFLLSFLANLLLGYLFVAHGLLYSMALRFLFGMKYLAVAWIVG